MILTYTLIAIAVVILVFAAVVAMQPAEFRIVRTAAIPAPPADVFAQVNDFHHWEAWSPWAKLDPMAKNSFEGAAAGTGAIFSWSGNSKVGAGRMTIMESRPSDLIRINLKFLRPFKATNTAEFTFNPDGNQTMVTWSMLGQNNFLSKAFCLFVNMDKMIGADFEKGLTNMKSVLETLKK